MHTIKVMLRKVKTCFTAKFTLGSMYVALIL